MIILRKDAGAGNAQCTRRCSVKLEPAPSTIPRDSFLTHLGQTLKLNWNISKLFGQPYIEAIALHNLT